MASSDQVGLDTSVSTAFDVWLVRVWASIDSIMTGKNITKNMINLAINEMD